MKEPLKNCPLCGGDGTQTINGENFQCACIKIDLDDTTRMQLMENEAHNLSRQERGHRERRILFNE